MKVTNYMNKSALLGVILCSKTSELLSTCSIGAQ